MRRLIVIAARGIEPKPLRPGMMTKVSGKIACRERMAFPLFDRRKHVAPPGGEAMPRLGPRLHVFGGDPRVTMFRPPPPPEARRSAAVDGLVSIRRLRLRLGAVALALTDLPRQARRLVRWQARRRNAPDLKFTSPLRPGPPPGHRRIPVRDVDFVLAECHGLAHDAVALDTS